jgi:zinc transport system ATP-binding protein
VGENGSGKTTLMKALLGLLPAQSGSLEIADELKNGIGYLPQYSEAQMEFPASVEEVVMSGCIGHTGIIPLYRRADRERAHDNLRRLGIDGLQRVSYRELSGGQRQRVLLARALCAANKMILLDEPVSGLDPAAASEMYRIIESLNKEDKITVIMISHDVGAAIKYASHILHLAHTPRFFGKTEDYVKSDVFFGVKGEDDND